MNDLVLRTDIDGVATLTLNRPDKLNALNDDVFRALRTRVDDIAVDESMRCVVITGAGRAFSAGHDLSALTQGPYDPTFEAETVDALELLPQPAIAAIRGHCVTGGLELALGADLLVATESARFADSHGKWGLVPVWGLSVRLPERIGVANAKMMMFTSQHLTSAQALAIGLIDQVVDDAELDAAVGRLTSQIGANSRGTNREEIAARQPSPTTPRPARPRAHAALRRARRHGRMPRWPGLTGPAPEFRALPADWGLAHLGCAGTTQRCDPPRTSVYRYAISILTNDMLIG
jgi:enoyl-CoA hydratase